jgi:hypothetical protein
LAQNSAKNGKGGNGYVSEIEFAYVSLTDAHDRDYEQWIKNEAGNTEDILEVLVGDGYSVSLSKDLVSDGFKCSFTTKLPKHINSGICITSWSDSVLDALYLNYWKTYILFEGKRAPVKTEGGGRVRR